MEQVLNIFSYFGWVILAIMILVFIHELGHFLFAKLFKMRVDKFSVGFPPKVIGTTVGETEYVIGLTPLGGYVKIAGMVDESMDTEELESEPKPWEFRSKPVWQRIIVITGGVFFNMILAAVIFIGLKAAYGSVFVPPLGGVFVAEESIAYDMGLRSGDTIVQINGKTVEQNAPIGFMKDLLAEDGFRVGVIRDGENLTFTGPEDIMTRLNKKGALGILADPPVLGLVSPGSAADDAGLLRGDRIIAIGEARINFFEELREIVSTSDGSELIVRWERPDSLASIVPAGAIRVSDLTSEPITYEARITPREESGRLILGVNSIRYYEDFTFAESIPAGIKQVFSTTQVIFLSLKRIFTGRENFRENVGGPIMIAKATKEAADQGAYSFWNIVAMLSITLAIINILPIPALDGGHLVFLLYEGIVRKEPSLKVRMAMQQVGMVMLLAFMAFVIFNDILKL